MLPGCEPTPCALTITGNVGTWYTMHVLARHFGGKYSISSVKLKQGSYHMYEIYINRYDNTIHQSTNNKY